MKRILEIRDVAKHYDTPAGEQVIVQGIDLDVREGEFLSLIGHSGCGKSTLMSMVAGLVPLTSGTMLLEGTPVQGPGPERAMVFQSPSLLPWLSAEANVLLGIDQAYPGASPAERRAIAEHFLALLGILDVRHKKPAELSAGARQRVGVARAFALRPRLLLLDEPFGSLDSLTRFELQDVLGDLCRRTHTTAVLVTHDVDEALYLSDRIAMMTDGPAARIGEVLEVPFPHPRDRNGLIGTEAYDDLRDRMLAFLEHTSAHREAAASA